jgi:hypothetical protein
MKKHRVQPEEEEKKENLKAEELGESTVQKSTNIP